ncbi:MAG: tRNA threonylcarbamoyladenosine biosynthesis protein TsaB [Gammaproteobacteria bacterium]|nr:tRNA threonylcarbamoyladenosine biosynthesis protein TsaB [Gammaproteobacteria bacterium]
MKILALDTATENCSAALWIKGTILQREVEAERGHAELILSMIDELLRESATRLADLDAIAFGRGPGSFTGVRLAASVTQGLAFGAGVPVVPVSDLQAVAQRAASQHVLVCNDARMQEVYWACFEMSPDGSMRPSGSERVSKPSEVQLPVEWAGQSATGAGRGFAAYTSLRERLADQLTNIDGTLLPRAREVALLAVPDVQAGRVLPPEAAIPVYIRDDVARPKAP